MSTICIKIGGSTIDAPQLFDELAQSIASVSKDHFVVLVHGGGKDIGRQLDLLKKNYTFIEGMRVTDHETMRHVQMVLSGDVNKRFVNAMLLQGVTALGISGVDAGMLEATRLTIHGQDLGQVGEVSRVNPRILHICRAEGIVPVISPVCRGSDGQFYNVNADPVAAEIAIALNADHLMYVSDVPGVLLDNKVAPVIRISEIDFLISSQQIKGGMIPKLRAAVHAVQRGVGRLHICGWHGPQTIEQELAVETSHGTVVY